MFVKRYLLLLLILFQTSVVAENYGGEHYSLPSNKESGRSSFVFPSSWLPNSTGFNMPERFRRDQGAIKGSHATNPWALPVSQWVSAMPQYLGSALRENDYAPTSQYMKQMGEQNAASLGVHSSSGFHFSEQSNSQVSSQQPYAESSWHQPPSFQPVRPKVPAPVMTMHHFQQRPRFVTPEILEALNRPQVPIQPIAPFNPYQKGVQQKPRCCQNHQRQMNSQNYMGQTSQPTNKQHYKQANRYSNGLMMPFTVDAGQLNKERLLYMGDSLPTVPDAAIGGLPPMNIFGPLPPVLSGTGDDGIDWGTNRFGIGPYGASLQQ